MTDSDNALFMFAADHLNDSDSPTYTPPPRHHSYWEAELTRIRRTLLDVTIHDQHHQHHKAEESTRKATAQLLSLVKEINGGTIPMESL